MGMPPGHDLSLKTISGAPELGVYYKPSKTLEWRVYTSRTVSKLARCSTASIIVANQKFRRQESQGENSYDLRRYFATRRSTKTTSCFGNMTKSSVALTGCTGNAKRTGNSAEGKISLALSPPI